MKLNAIQEVMANHVNGPALIFAVAGSGKTTGIVERVSRMYQRGIDPRSILVTTFNKDAAEEIKKRLKQTYGSIVDLAPIKTTHALGRGILVNTGMRVSLITEYKAKDLLKNKLRRIKGKIQPGEEADMLKYIGFMKNHLAWFEDIPGLPFGINMIHALRKLESMQGVEGELVATCYEEYETFKMKENLLDIDDYLFRAYWQLMTDKATLAHYQQHYKYMMVDEYQDTNEAQYQIFKLLAAIHNNFMAVGDDDQSIYGFRGSSPQHIQQFKNDYPDAVVVALEQNYRSQAGIVHAANILVKNNQFRQPKEIDATLAFKRKPVHVECSDPKTEARFIAESIFYSNFAPTSIAILTRTNAQQCFIEDALIDRQIPYYVINSTPFFKRKEIQAILSYLKIAANEAPEDEIMDEVRNMANKPYRQLGKDEIMRWRNLQALCNVPKGYEYHDAIQYLRSVYEQQKNNMALVVDSIINYPMNLSWWVKQDGQVSSDNNSMKNMEMFKDLCRGLKLSQVMDKIERSEIEYAKMQDKKDGVAVCTIHGSKGLEWDEVYIAGCNQGILPHKSSNDLEEERRLGYVAITRAREFLILTSYHDDDNERSQFIDELKDAIDHDYVNAEEGESSAV